MSEPQNITLEKREKAAHIAQVQDDLNRLNKEITQLQRDHATMQRIIARSPRTNILCGGIVLIITAMAWYLDGPDWLRFYAFPAVLIIMLITRSCFRKLERWMQRKIAEYESFVELSQKLLLEAQQQTSSDVY